MTDHVILKPGKERAIRNRHHWIFSGAVASLPKFSDGDFLPVYSSAKELLGTGYFNRKSSIIGRMVSFGSQEPLEAIEANITHAIALRKQLFSGNDTDAFRLINGEGDCLPGLIVDHYGETLVVQLTTLGMDRQRTWLTQVLNRQLNPKAIYEKSILPARKEEGLSDVAGWLKGSSKEDCEIRENGLKFFVSVIEGQKTGFFLDHREMRQQVRRLSQGKKVLNCFSYTGGFSVYAMAGGSVGVDTVDISPGAIETAKRNMALNGFDTINCGFHAEDVFKFLRERELNYDLIILDPPAFAKRQKDLVPACRGYKDINRLVLQKIPKGSILLTSSCSYHVNEELFQKVVFQASVEANRTVKIIGRHQLASDHPINLCHPEGDYLKSLLLYVE